MQFNRKFARINVWPTNGRDAHALDLWVAAILGGWTFCVTLDRVADNIWS